MGVQQNLLSYVKLLPLPREPVEDGVDLVDGALPHRLLVDRHLVLLVEEQGKVLVSHLIGAWGFSEVVFTSFLIFFSHLYLEKALEGL